MRPKSSARQRSARKNGKDKIQPQDSAPPTPSEKDEVRNKNENQHLQTHTIDSVRGIDVAEEFIQNDLLPKDTEQRGDMGELAKDIEKCFIVEKPEPKQYMIKKRPDFGKCGRKISVIANYFPLILPTGNVYHYDVNITLITPGPLKFDTGYDKKKLRPLSWKVNRKIIEIMRTQVPAFKNCYPAFDGNKNIFTRKPLPIDGETTFIVDLEPNNVEKRNSQFSVAIKPVMKKDARGTSCAISLDSIHHNLKGTVSDVPLESVMAIETILRHCPSLQLVPVGRSFFLPSATPWKISGGLNVLSGYHQSVHIGQQQVLLNIDMATTTFYPSMPLLQFASILLNTDKRRVEDETILRECDIRKLTKEFKKVRIYVRHLKYERTYIIQSISLKGAKDIKIQDLGISVVQYFLNTYNIKLKYPYFPCINCGSNKKPCFQPLELCFICPEQPFRSKLNEKQTSEIIKYTAIRPRDRFKKIRENVEKVDSICDPIKREFQIQIAKKPLEFTARQLSAPSLVYNNNSVLKPINGVWDLKNNGFFKTVLITKWVVISLAFTRLCGKQDIDKFIRMLQDGARNVGMRMENPLEICYDSRKQNPQNLLESFEKKYSGLELAVVIIRNDQEYGLVKCTGDLKLGLPTQCIKDLSVVKKCNPQFMCNVCLKINAKLGGVNASLSPQDKPALFKTPVIIIGADVNHPSIGETESPSFSALVGSLDSYPGRYAVSVRVQKRQMSSHPELEIITDLKGMVKELLNTFYHHNNKRKPTRIIFFRDGISDGEFKEVSDKEINMIHEACRELGSDYAPTLTFVVVQKRHHTRFMPSRDQDGVGNCANIPPGTTVDTDIFQGNDFEYFQCSHFGIQGTSRPTKYSVLYDDNNLTSDEIQNLTHCLCHTYTRCTRSIAVPAPVRYAHLAAFRAKDHLANLNANYSDETDGVGHSISQEELCKMITVPGNFKKSMYFV